MPSGVIRIGTCSWTEKSLIESGAFYPRDLVSAEQRLRFYASRFDTVEVDSSYYSIPTVRMTQAWADRTPDKFLFHVKAFGALTGHSINPVDLPDDLRDMLPAADRELESVHVSDPAPLRAMAGALVAALAPLKSAGKLGFVIFQSPPWFTHKKANREYLLYCKEMMSGLPIAVEFRHGSWLTRQHAADLFSFLQEHKITYITCDEPQLGNLATVPFIPERTTCIAYLRLHGRNAESWQLRGDQRHEYLYDAKELGVIARAARLLGERTRMTFVMFNNCHGGNAINNALQLRKMLAVSRDPHAAGPPPSGPGA
jgi:uncharacterized protein YecE (DUF72 family)